MKCLITGANGFVGKHLSNLLSKKGDELFKTDISGQDFIRLDILDKEEVLKYIEKTQPDAIYHLAAQSSIPLSFEKPELTRDINVKGTKNILEAIKQTKINARVLIIGSSDEYGNMVNTPCKETEKLNPLNPYSKSKVEAEQVALKYFRDHHLNVIITRTFPIIGPGQNPKTSLGSFAKQIVESEKGKRDSIHVGNIDVIRDFIDVRDVVTAYNLLIEKGKPGETYNVCTGEGYKLKEILDKMVHLSGREIKIIQKQERIRKNEVMVSVGDNSKIFSQTGWKPKMSIDQSLKDLISYFEAKTPF